MALRELRFGHAGVARVWDAELSPYGAYEAIGIQAIDARARPSTSTLSRMGTVDWKRHSGKVDHAMLGAQFVPSNGTKWRAVVPIASADGPLTGETIVGDHEFERVRVGLAREYFEGLELLCAKWRQMRAGSLRGHLRFAGLLTVKSAQAISRFGA